MALNNTDHNRSIESALILVQRLGYLSADSVWAHRASGLRASLDKFLANIDQQDYDAEKLDSLIHQGFDILEKAAQKIPALEDTKDTAID